MQAQSSGRKKHGTKVGSYIRKEALNWLKHTQFHGANILASGEASMFWIPLMLALLTFAMILMCLPVQRYQARPTYVSHEETTYYKQSFSSVIICPQIRFESYKKEKFLSNLKYPNGLNRSYIWDILPQLSAFSSPDVLFNISDLQNIENFLRYNNIEVENATRQLTLSCEETLLRCRWAGIIVNCSELFRMELTGDGLCCVFNGRSLRREMQEKENKYIEKSTTKWLTSEVSYNHCLMVAINQSQKHDAVDFSYKWMSLQPARLFVDININGTPINPSREQWHIHNLHNLYITEDAKNLSPNLRKCNMETYPLKYFPIYRQRYCILECEMARTVRMCGCLRTVHPRPRGIPYCSANHVQCARHAMLSLTNMLSCLCPPMCTADMGYSVMSSYMLNSADSTMDSFYNDLDYNKTTVIRAFLSRTRKTMQRRSYFSFLDLFAQLGGMFNVVFGCSVLTILSLLHFILKLMMVLCWRLRQATPKIKKII